MKRYERFMHNKKSFKDMSLTELESAITELKNELFNLRFQHVTGQLDDTNVIKSTKRKIAIAKTLQSQQLANESN